MIYQLIDNYTLHMMALNNTVIHSSQDRLPERFTAEPASDPDGHTVDVNRMLPEYYKLRNWDENGVPTPEHVKDLGIGE